MGMIFHFRPEPFVHTLVSQRNDEISKLGLALARKMQWTQSVFLSQRRLISACVHLHDKVTLDNSFLGPQSKKHSINKNRRLKNSDGEEVGFSHEPGTTNWCLKKRLFLISGYLKKEDWMVFPWGACFLSNSTEEYVMAWAIMHS